MEPCLFWLVTKNGLVIVRCLTSLWWTFCCCSLEVLHYCCPGIIYSPPQDNFAAWGTVVSITKTYLIYSYHFCVGRTSGIHTLFLQMDDFAAPFPRGLHQCDCSSQDAQGSMHQHASAVFFSHQLWVSVCCQLSDSRTLSSIQAFSSHSCWAFSLMLWGMVLSPDLCQALSACPGTFLMLSLCEIVWLALPILLVQPWRHSQSTMEMALFLPHSLNCHWGILWPFTKQI